jgi:tripeptidyl-peptidase I
LGTTVLYASGDDGVAGNGGNCTAGVKFDPGFPSSCPFVTAVGATQINPGSTVFEPESVMKNRTESGRLISSGGGFSDIFAMPSYQATAIDNYLKDHPPPYTALQYNNSGMVMTLLHCE